MRPVTPKTISMDQWIDLRDSIMQRITQLATSDPRIVVLDADVSKSTRSRLFGKQYPNRFFNVGIAELHMASMAAALAAEGMVPCVCSFAAFLALRALEPIRTQIAYSQLPAVLLGGYAGLSAMQHGPTHQCLVDLAIYNAIQGMTVLSPSDSCSAADLTAQAVRLGSPAYIRVGYHVQSPIYSPGQVKIGECYQLQDGHDILVISTGLPTLNALKAAQSLRKRGIMVSVLDCPTLKPFPAKDVAALADGFDAVVTVEDHVKAGGLYAQVITTLHESGCHTRVYGIHMGDRFAQSAPYDVLQQFYGLDPDGISQTLEYVLGSSSRAE